jgi:hypothetical protein
VGEEQVAALSRACSEAAAVLGADRPARAADPR